jgi:hypothetical protein
MTLRDDGETIGLFEPLMVSEGSPHRAELNDLALELATHSAGFRASLPASIADALAALIRSMNCYYSNLIEGHHTHPVDIERALKDDYTAAIRNSVIYNWKPRPISLCRNGSTKVALMAMRPRQKPFWSYTVAFMSACRQT